jgi:hypothetical protein
MASSADRKRRRTMLTKIMKTVVPALVFSGIFLAAISNASAAPRGWTSADQFGLGYSNTARHDPRNTNGF